MDTVLLFGGRSFLGGHLCRVLVRRGYRVLLHSSSSADFKNLRDLGPNACIEPVVCGFDKPRMLQELMDGSQFAIYAAIPYSKQSIGQFARARQDLREFGSTLRMLRDSPIRRTVFVSVSGTIGRVNGGIADETCAPSVGTPGGWGHLKGKIAAEYLIAQHVLQGLQAVVVNPSMCVGEFDTKPSTGEFFRFFVRCPFALMPNELLNIVDVEDVASGTVLALERGVVGERYILSGTNTTIGMFTQRVRQLAGKSMPRIPVPRRMAIITAYFFEIMNLIFRGPKPVVPLLGMELIEQGSQHLSCEKATRELGFVPRNAWVAVDRAYHWYKKNGML